MTALTGTQPAGEPSLPVAHPGSRARSLGYSSGKADYQARLRTIEGQVRGRSPPPGQRNQSQAAKACTKER